MSELRTAVWPAAVAVAETMEAGETASGSGEAATTAAVASAAAAKGAAQSSGRASHPHIAAGCTTVSSACGSTGTVVGGAACGVALRHRVGRPATNAFFSEVITTRSTQAVFTASGAAKYDASKRTPHRIPHRATTGAAAALPVVGLAVAGSTTAGPSVGSVVAAMSAGGRKPVAKVASGAGPSMVVAAGAAFGE